MQGWTANQNWGAQKDEIINKREWLKRKHKQNEQKQKKDEQKGRNEKYCVGNKAGKNIKNERRNVGMTEHVKHKEQME